MRFSRCHFAIVVTQFVVFFGALLSSDLFGAVWLVVSVLTITLLSATALNPKNLRQTQYLAGSLLGLFVLAWIATLFVASSRTSEYVEAKIQQRNASAVALNVIDDDPYRAAPGRMIMLHKSI